MKVTKGKNYFVKSPGLDDIERSVSEDGTSSGESSEETDDQFGNGLLRISFAVPILERLHHVEPDRLVAALLHDGRGHTFGNKLFGIEKWDQC